MPQTIEAINHASAAGVPMVLPSTKLINKVLIRKNPEHGQYEHLVEEWEENTNVRKFRQKGTNIDKLLDKVLLEADLLELKANLKTRQRNRH